MKPKHFIQELDEARIIAAIGAEERRTSGEIRVYISNHERHDPLAAAQGRFLAMEMQKTRERNAVLIYFAPRTHQFALWGDIGVHEKCGETFWAEITAGMTPLLKNGRLTEAVEHAVKAVGAALAKHFPRRPDDTNELPNEIVRD
jgi:uncharacterized membrane protein